MDELREAYTQTYRDKFKEMEEVMAAVLPRTSHKQKGPLENVTQPSRDPAFGPLLRGESCFPAGPSACP